MRRTTLRLLLLSLFFLPLSASAALTQEKKAEEAERTGSVYRVDFAVQELEDGKRLNTRHYLMLLEAGRGREGRIRTSSRVPVSVSGGGWQFMDIGLSLDCALREHTNGLALEVTLDLSNFVPRETEEGMPPIVRKIRSSVNTVVLPGKPTVVSRVEDTATGRRYELEVTATKVN